MTIGFLLVPQRCFCLVLVQNLSSAIREHDFSEFLQHQSGEESLPLYLTPPDASCWYICGGALREGVWNIPVWVASPPAAGKLANRKESATGKKFVPSLLQKRRNCKSIFPVGLFSFGKERKARS